MPTNAPDTLYNHITKTILDLEDDEIAILAAKGVKKTGRLKNLKIKTIRKWHDNSDIDDILHQELESFLMFLDVKKPSDVELLAMDNEAWGNTDVNDIERQYDRLISRNNPPSTGFQQNIPAGVDATNFLKFSQLHLSNATQILSFYKDIYT